ncbi:carboxyltransferase domain-containing protein [Microbacterium sp. CH-015]|uniref:5-oxoprolinase subunit B/C family protein n=1 Tax=Microbacterium sp. CH-015 TaxID=3406734 RepID=UPI003C723D42
MTVRILPFGDRALLAEVADLGAMLSLHGRLAASRPAGVVDLVPAARTVLVAVDPAVLSLAAARAWIGDAAGAGGADVMGDAVGAGADPTGPLVELPIVYDGADLAETAGLVGLGTAELAARHAAAEWSVAFTGFAPGFGYLVSADWPFPVPRLDRPRSRVPAGAVGLAGPFTGAYPRSSPGGWRLIGTTSAVLFDPAAATPALLQPGTRVRFRPAPALPASAPALAAPYAPAAPSAPSLAARPRPCTETPEARRGLGAATTSRRVGTPAGRIRVLTPGPLATVQDQGRPGALAAGVAVSGAADRAALRIANRLVGTDERAAGVEITLGGFRAVWDAAASGPDTDLWFAVTGAWGAIRLGGRAVDPYVAHPWPSGAELEIDGFDHGARAYLAVRGGIAASAVLGSRATDTLAGLGPAPLAAGATLAPAGDVTGPVPPADLHPWGPPPGEVEVALAPGPRADWFASSSPLFDAVWTVSPQADRVGIRLDGPALPRVRDDELPSEGMLPGAIQVPPDARPVILGPDGPVTGGYPVIAVVTDAARDLLAQARPGTRIRFRHARPA